jgi:hypothetical protein
MRAVTTEAVPLARQFPLGGRGGADAAPPVRPRNLWTLTTSLAARLHGC